MTRPSHTARILELLRAGRSPAVIAAELGVTPGRVRQVAQAHAIPLPRSPRPGRPRSPAVASEIRHLNSTFHFVVVNG